MSLTIGTKSSRFFIDELNDGTCKVSRIRPGGELDALDNRRIALLNHDGMSIPVGGDSRHLVLPSEDIRAAVISCSLAKVKVVISGTAIELASAVYAVQSTDVMNVNESMQEMAGLQQQTKQ